MIDTIHTTTQDGASVAARVCGVAGPALVFIHGVGSTAAIWDAQLTSFGATNRCIAIELRGNGVPKPEPDPTLITREGYATDVLAIARAVGVDRFTIIGCSLGGVVAFELWKRAPQHIAALALVGTFAAYPDAESYVAGIVASVRRAGSMAVFANERAAKLGLPPERLRETLDQMSCKSVPSYLAATQATWTGDYRSTLSTIDVPTWVTCGDHDTIAPPALSREIATLIQGATMTVIESAGHVANADAPDAFNHQLREFLS